MSLSQKLVFAVAILGVSLGAGFVASEVWGATSQVFQAGSGVEITTDNANQLDISTQATTGGNIHLYVRSAGTGIFIASSTANVGIGTTSPTYKLEVIGNTKIKGRLDFFDATTGNQAAYIGPYGDIGISGGEVDDLEMKLIKGLNIGVNNSVNSAFYLKSDGNVGIATTTPAYGLTVVGTGYFSQPVIVGTPTVAAHAATRSYVDSATVGQTGWTDGGANVYLTTTGDNVGIGTTGPSEKLQTVGRARFDDIWVGTWTSASRIESNAASTFYVGTGVAQDMILKANSADVLTVKSGGNVGIGTTGPNTLLHAAQSFAAGSDTGATLKLETTRTNNAGMSPLLYFKDNYASGYNWAIGGTDTGVDFGIRKAAVGTFPNSHVLTILGASGNVGIASSSPGYGLTVVGTGYFSQPVIVGTPTAVSHAATKSYVDSQVSGWTDGGANVYLTTTGDNVGIGTTGPQGKLHVKHAAGSSNVVLESDDTAPIAGDDLGQIDWYNPALGGNVRARILGEADGVWSGGSYPTRLSFWTNINGTVFAERMRIDKDGNVGIGTTNPGVKLDVSGGTGTAIRILGGGDLTIVAQTSGADAVLYNDTGRLESSVNFNAPQLCIAGTCQSSWPSGAVTSVFARTGAVVAASGDYSVSQVTGAAPLASPTFTGTVSGITATMVGLGNVTNESKATMFTSPAFTGSVTMPGAGIWNSSGNVGIGTTGSGEKLTVAGGSSVLGWYGTGLDGTTYQRMVVYTDSTNQVLFEAPKPGNLTINAYDYNFSWRGGGVGLFMDGPTGDVGIGLTNPATKLEVLGTLTVSTVAGNGAGKINAGTIDPPYIIEGKPYATYMPAMTGVKEETTGAVKLSGGEYVLDLMGVEEGSDLWLFAQVVNVNGRAYIAEDGAVYQNSSKEIFDNMTVLLTPSFDGKVWYEKDVEGKRVTIRGSKDGEVSYRLAAPRFDYREWSNRREEGATGGFNLDKLLK